MTGTPQASYSKAMNKETQPVRVGVIGAGEHASQSHITHLEQLPGCEFSGFADDNFGQLATMGEVYFPRFTTFAGEDIVTDPDTDAVVIVADNQTNAHLLDIAVQNGKHVLVETPLATSWPEYELIRNSLGAAREQGLVVTGCHPHRYDPPLTGTKRLLNDRSKLAELFGLVPNYAIGQVTSLAVGVNHKPLSKEDKDGSFGFDHIGHMLDAASYILGYSGLQKFKRSKNTAAKFDVQITREDGINLYSAGNHLHEGPDKETLALTFNSGLTFTAHSGGLLTLSQGPHERPVTPRNDDGQPLFASDINKCFSGVNANFIHAVQGREINYLTAEELLLSTLGAVAAQNPKNIKQYL